MPACMQKITHESTALTDDNVQLKNTGIKPGTFIEVCYGPSFLLNSSPLFHLSLTSLVYCIPPLCSLNPSLTPFFFLLLFLLILLLLSLSQVSYECEAEVQKVGRIIEWINYMTSYLENMHPIVSTEIGIEADMLTTIGLNERMCERLALNYFSPSGAPRVEANKRYFLSKKGPAKLCNLLYIIISQPWGQQFLRLKLLESKILDAMRCFGQGNVELQKVLVDEGVVGYALMMLHRVRLVAGQPVEDRMGSWGAREHNNFLVVEMLGSVIEILWL